MVDTSKLTDTVRYLIKCCFRYYVVAQPCEADVTYDKLLHALDYFELKQREVSPLSPTVKIWGDRAEQYPDWARAEPTEQEQEAAYDLLNQYEEMAPGAVK